MERRPPRQRTAGRADVGPGLRGACGSFESCVRAEEAVSPIEGNLSGRGPAEEVAAALGYSPGEPFRPAKKSKRDARGHHDGLKRSGRFASGQDRKSVV